MLSKQILDLHPRSDSTELAEAVPIDSHVITNSLFKILFAIGMRSCLVHVYDLSRFAIFNYVSYDLQECLPSHQ